MSRVEVHGPGMPDRIDGSVERAANHALDRARDVAKPLAIRQVPRRTGELQRALLAEVKVQRSWGRLVFHYDRMRALQQLIQSGRGEIRPRNPRGALYFQGHFYKRAGPVAPNPFMARIAAMLDRPVEEILDRGIERIDE